MSLAHWSLKNWSNLRESAKSPARGRKISSHTCYALHEAFALSLRPEKASASIKERLMSMVRELKQVTHARNAADVPLMAAGAKNNTDRIEHVASFTANANHRIM